MTPRQLHLSAAHFGEPVTRKSLVLAAVHAELSRVRTKLGRVEVLALTALLTACSPGHPTPASAPRRIDPAPPLTVTVDGSSGAAGFVLINGGAPGLANLLQGGNPGIPSGPEILDKRGRPVWFLQIPNDQDSGNVQVQTYLGKPVLTWWQGGKTVGADYISDDSYHIIKKLTVDGGETDPHEFRLTPDGHALITSTKDVPVDLTSIGGPKDGHATDCLANIVDVASGKTLFHWDTIGHLPLTDSALTYDQLAKVSARQLLPLHINSIAPDPRGNLLLSIRSANELVDVNPATGAINWKLGGKQSTFDLGPGVPFAGQHDAQFVDDQTIMVFNNNIDIGGQRHGPSSIEWIRIDEQDRTASLVRNLTQPDALATITQGSAQALPDGDTFTGWGDGNRITEFAPDGHIVWNATQPVPPGARPDGIGGIGTYRAFLQPWSGHPTEKPELTVRNDNKSLTLHAVWNGATDVARWNVLEGESLSALRSVVVTDWNGLDTPIPTAPAVLRTGVYFELQALDKTGKIIGTSESTKL